MFRDDPSGQFPATSLVDSGERKRLSFWQQHAMALQSDLLEITGWLGFDPEREVFTETGTGLRVVTAGSKPANVLFLVPPEGTRTYRDWEWCLRYLRLEQSRRWLVRQRAHEAQRELEDAERELKEIRARHEQLEGPLREVAEKARQASRERSAPGPSELARELAEGLAQARANLEAHRLAERRRDRLGLRLQGLRDHLVPRVYPGLWSRINAFLDLQALTVASVAGEEFRKTPRPLTGLAARLERDLEAD